MFTTGSAQVDLGDGHRKTARAVRFIPEVGKAPDWGVNIAHTVPAPSC